MRKFKHVITSDYVNSDITVYEGDYDYGMLSEAMPRLREGALILRTLSIQADITNRDIAASNYLTDTKEYRKMPLLKRLFAKRPVCHQPYRPSDEYDNNLQLLEQLQIALDMYKDHPDLFIFVDKHGEPIRLRQV